MNEYQKQAIEFLEKTGAKIQINFLKNDFHFVDDKEKRDIYIVSIQRGSRNYTFNIGNSIANSGFYVKQGKSITQLDRKYVNSQNLWSYIRNTTAIPFNPKIDTIHKPTPPTEYDILTCLQKYNPGTLSNFCDEYGYNEDSKKSTKIYEAVRDEFLNLIALFNDSEMNELKEIQ